MLKANIFVIAISILLITTYGCKKGITESGHKVSPISEYGSAPQIPADADGVFYLIDRNYRSQYDSSVYFERYAMAWFGDSIHSKSIGQIKLNDYIVYLNDYADKYTYGWYETVLFYDTSDLDFATWHVSGNGAAPAFNVTDTTTMPAMDWFTINDTIDVTNDYTFNIAGLSGHDQLLCRVEGAKGHFDKTVPANSNSITFTAQELQSSFTAALDFRLVQVTAVRMHSKIINGKKYYFVKMRHYTLQVFA